MKTLYVDRKREFLLAKLKNICNIKNIKIKYKIPDMYKKMS